MEAKIRRLLERLEELERILGQPETVLDRPLFRKLSQEHAYLRELKEAFLFYKKAQEELDQSKALLLTEKDPEMIAIIKEEISSLQQKIDLAKKKVETLLVPPDPRDSRNIILELRAGTGGDEAALFVGDSLRMYKAYADRKGWKTETISSSLSELGGFKEYIMALSGPNVFRYMQYEGGTHRVQRVPKTETQGRVHTSAITVAVLIEPEEQDVEIDERDLQIDTYRSSGAGGQHVNVTDSAVRITHKPSGIVVACQDERSQHKNKDKAMRLLKAKLAEEMARAQKEEQSALRSKQVGTGDRSEKIRTYNFPQNRLTDHRIDLTLYKLDQVMDGDLDDITEALVAFFYQQKLLSE